MLLAVGVVALDPILLTGDFYHPLMIGVVHLVTLDWISGSILGALFLVAPLALRMPMPVGRLDYWAFGFFAIGVSGMVSHCWIQQFSGMAWSAAMVVLAVAQVASRSCGSYPGPRSQWRCVCTSVWPASIASPEPFSAFS